MNNFKIFSHNKIEKIKNEEYTLQYFLSEKQSVLTLDYNNVKLKLQAFVISL